MIKKIALSLLLMTTTASIYADQQVPQAAAEIEEDDFDQMCDFDDIDLADVEAYEETAPKPSKLTLAWAIAQIYMKQYKYELIAGGVAATAATAGFIYWLKNRNNEASGK